MEDRYLFEAEPAEYDHEKRIKSIKENIEFSLEYSKFKCYYSLIENVNLSF